MLVNCIILALLDTKVSVVEHVDRREKAPLKKDKICSAFLAQYFWTSGLAVDEVKENSYCISSSHKNPPNHQIIT